MVDKFKAKGTLVCYSYDESCLNYSNTDRDTPVWKYMKIPNREETDFLEFSYLQSNPQKIRIQGNLRKWWYVNGRAVRDLNFSDTLDALNFLAKRIGANIVDVYNLPITYIEMGGNIKLDKIAELFIPSTLEYPQLETLGYGRNSIYFVGEKYKIILYNKLYEMGKHDPDLPVRLAKKMLSSIYILRYEIKVTSPSGYSRGKWIQNFGALLKNYDRLVDDWLDRFMLIQFVDKFSASKDMSSQSMTKKEFQDYLSFLMLEELGLSYGLYLSDYYVKSHNSRSRTDLKEIYEKFRTNDNRSAFIKIAGEVAKKAAKMKK